MRGDAASRGLLVLLASASGAWAQDGAPPLAPPAEARAAAEPAPAPRTLLALPRAIPALPRSRSLLPTLEGPPDTAPALIAPTLAPFGEPWPAPAPASGDPPALKPLAPGVDTAPGRFDLAPFGTAAAAGTPAPTGPTTNLRRPGILSLEPIEPERFRPLPDPAPGRSASRSAPAPEEEEPLEPTPRTPPGPERRGLLGLRRLFAPPARSEAPVRIEARSDPAADMALKRRLEARVREAVGEDARNIDVFVAGRRILIRARADRIWNRRRVRRAIESLPALAGYDARVEVD